MEQKRNYLFPLEELLAVLKASGYELSIQQVLDIEMALLTNPVSRMKVNQLKYLVAPVIAKNKDEQRHLHQLIDAYIAEKTKLVAPPEKPTGRWLRENKKLVLALKITAFLMVAATGILFYILRNETPPVKPVTPKAVVEKKNEIKRDTATVKTPVERRLKSSSVPTKQVKPVQVSTKPSGIAIVPQPIDFNLQMSGTFGAIMGIIMAWIVFYERKKKMEMKDKKRADDAIFVKRSEYLHKANASGFEPQGEVAQPIIRFAERDYLVVQPRALQKIKSYLKRPALIQNPGVDIKKSIGQSIRNAGYTSLAYTSEWKDRKYLIISDNLHADAHITGLLNYLIDGIQASIPAVVRYSYTGNAETVQDENGNPVSFEELAYRHRGYNLIIIDNGYSFFHTKNEQLKKELNAFFDIMASRSVITPKPLDDWSNSEDLIVRNNFQIVPADIAEIELLAKAIAEDSPVTKNQLLNRLPNAYSVTNFSFETVQSLKQYLDEEKLFQPICALAVYPRLQWPLTLALFEALKVELTYDLLLKTARIPWLHKDQLDDKIRLELLNSLTAETEVIARETIISLLDEVRNSTAENSPAFTELNTQYNINAFFLFSYDQYKYRQYGDTQYTISDYWRNLTEWALQEHVDSGSSALLPRRRSDQSSVDEFLLKEKQFDSWNVNFLRVVLVTLPTLLLYITFSIFKPEFVYPKELYKNVSFSALVTKNTSCIQQLNYVINSTNGRSDTIILSQLPTDSILINDVKYNSVINLELWTKDSLMYPVSFNATDSFCEVRADCR
ncbi:hypothetical protein [Niastella sp. OAS944]|uniref:hypothetical protein n=1 Tax=Niastella sp. OAS944 TaxID=2664089 RepID=UPI00348DB1A3|nr:hypothetical protein [Chitinophagaceae bacterium OAS944]